MQKMAGYEKVREWWDITDGMQVHNYPPPFGFLRPQLSTNRRLNYRRVQLWVRFLVRRALGGGRVWKKCFT